MANFSSAKGMASELIAQSLLIAKGYSVHVPLVAEPYDLVAHENGTKNSFKIQVNTLRIRNDREDALVVKATSSNGERYSKRDVDYVLAVNIDEGIGYLIENTEQKEYWAKDFATAASKWTELRLGGDTYGDSTRS